MKLRTESGGVLPSTVMTKTECVEAREEFRYAEEILRDNGYSSPNQVWFEYCERAGRSIG